MKKTSLIFLAALSLASVDAHAYDWRSMCKSMEVFAENVMTSRQLQVSMEKMIQLASNSSPDKETTDYFEEVIIDAYGTLALPIESYQAGAVKRFKNKVYRNCVKKYR